jgi:hypothetical protein
LLRDRVNQLVKERDRALDALAGSLTSVGFVDLWSERDRRLDHYIASLS